MPTDGISAQAVSQIAQNGASGGASSDALQSFNAAFQQAQQRQVQTVDVSGLQTMLSPLLELGEQSARLEAQVAPLNSSEYRPSELMMITMRSHEFLFRCELTANVANRASDGVQQLFRQQS